MLNVSRRILVSAPRDSVQRYLNDLGELAKCDRKVDEIKVSNDGDASLAEASGRFLGLPWNGTFRIERSRDGGFRGVMVEGPLSRMETRVALRPVPGGTVIEHAELYDLPFLMAPFRPLIRRWLTTAMVGKLDMIKEGAEALNRRIQLDKLEK